MLNKEEYNALGTGPEAPKGQPRQEDTTQVMDNKKLRAMTHMDNFEENLSQGNPKSCATEKVTKAFGLGPEAPEIHSCAPQEDFPVYSFVTL